MAADKRTPHTDALDTLGTIITEHERRDAIHLAVEPVTAGEELKPGQRVGMIGEGVAASSMNPVGIVDPFLAESVLAGERFWLILFPGSVTSLRHVWTHPAFDDPKPPRPAVEWDESSDSAWWLTNLASRIGVGRNELIERAREFVRHGDYWCEGSRFDGVRNVIDDKFWTHYEAVTGEKVAKEHRAGFLDCSC